LCGNKDGLYVLAWTLVVSDSNSVFVGKKNHCADKSLDACSKLISVVKSICDLFVIFFAGWTILVWLVVFVGKGSFNDLSIFSPLTFIFPLAYLYTVYNKDDPRLAGGGVVFRAGLKPPISGRYIYACFVALFFVLIIFGFEYFWAGAIVFLAANYLRDVRSIVRIEDVAEGGAVRCISFLIFCAACILISAVVQRPDSDDGFFINLAVTALDEPHRSLLAFDGTLNVPTIPLMPAYRIHSFELFLALVAGVLDVEPILVAHVILPSIMGALVAFSSGLILRIFLPFRWHVGCFFLLLFWLTMADPHEGFSNYGLVRIFQGKAVLFTALIPILIVNTIHAYNKPGTTSLGILAATIIAAVGLSSSGLFLGPILVVFTLFSLWAPCPKSYSRALLPLLCCLVLLPVAFVTWHSMQLLEPILNSSIIYGKNLTFDYAIEKVFGSGIYCFSQFVVLVCCWFFVENSAVKKFILSFTLIFFLTVFNPFLYDFWARYITSPPVFFRLFFLYPIPIFTSVLLVSLLYDDSKLSGFKARIFILSLVVFVFLFVPKFTTLSAANRVSLGSAFDLKVPPIAYSMAGLASEFAGPQRTILAPRAIAMWIPTYRHHSKLVAMKENYLKGMLPWIGAKEFYNRIKLFRYISGQQRSEDAVSLLAEQIEMYNLGVIIIPKRNRWSNEILTISHNYDFRVEEKYDYIVMVRGKSQ